MSIPVFPDFKPLELTDRPEVESFFYNFPQETCDYSFANLFIWRDYDHPWLTRLNDNLCILLEPVGGIPYFLPPVGEKKIDETLGSCFDHLKRVPPMRMAPEKFVKAHFERKTEYWFELDRANSDYVYRTTDLIALKGKKYDGKRNWIKRFLASYKAEYAALTAELVPACLELLEGWGRTRVGPVIKYELQAIAEALRHFRELGMRARVVLIGGKLEAFMMGGELGPEMAVVYIQVANREIPGLPQFFHQRFAALEQARYKYVNWEQDLAVPGLRKAKLSYHPCRLIHKYDVSKR